MEKGKQKEKIFLLLAPPSPGPFWRTQGVAELGTVEFFSSLEDHFPHMAQLAFPWPVSDHCPILLDMEKPEGGLPQHVGLAHRLQS